MSDPGLERLNRFIVAHGSCGEVAFTDPTEADILDDGQTVSITARCLGCGTTTREIVSTEQMFAGFGQLLQEAGVSLAEVAGALADEEKLRELSARVGQSPAMLRTALRSIRKAQEGETQN